jgi:hypothetical protein
MEYSGREARVSRQDRSRGVRASQEVSVPRSKLTPGAEVIIYTKEFLMNFKDVRRNPRSPPRWHTHGTRREQGTRGACVGTVSAC